METNASHYRITAHLINSAGYFRILNLTGLLAVILIIFPIADSIQTVSMLILLLLHLYPTYLCFRLSFDHKILLDLAENKLSTEQFDQTLIDLNLLSNKTNRSAIERCRACLKLFKLHILTETVIFCSPLIILCFFIF